MIVLIDNYDSFVFNVRSMLESLYKGEIKTIRNDELSLEEIISLKPDFIVLSPGPKHPKDSGVCLELINARLKIPILGICLGHQIIALSFKAKIKRLEKPAHAISSKIKLVSSNLLFKELPKSFKIMRYHSLEVVNLPKELEPLAFSEDGVLMAFAHKSLPYFGVQFHPESFFSEYGLKILSNFLSLKKSELQEEKKDFTPFLQKLSLDQNLDSEDFSQICSLIMSKDFEEIQLAALLVLITEKSLNEKSLTALIQNILKYSNTFNDDSDMIDIVGTGGDGFKTINISTTVAFILAALGLRVAKHGNKAISSKSGSSDVLSELKAEGFKEPQKQLLMLEKTRLCFFHAPFFHPLVGEVKSVRERLKLRTVFNILGPLLHPNLSLKYQLVGNYHAPVHKLIAEVLRLLGRKKALVVRGNDGLDELSICDETSIYELDDGEIIHYNISPEQFGFKRAFHSEIAGGSPKENAEILIKTLKGEQRGAKFDIVVLNAIFALYTAKRVDNPLKAKDMVLEAIYSGRVYEYFCEFQEERAKLSQI
ncbi:anthranilate phosphoribosyltransferase [Campylobacter sp. MIT 99-7217]|uniref:anthranilate phosphoribosyltransferase n=1 Tax=Campylobacter sp. MIT 99-7217 TaxID=535091 RepID=UPI001158E859|nr:anthranilate phosphoribosyltransferase [Campylobacter sp. MIT 99-7217]TQR33122.1 anthranilate phosphoribosyltransferase [Campylobacter sp. MIT 99-7217]